jgi:ankyrin repeat protein
MSSFYINSTLLDASKYGDLEKAREALENRANQKAKSAYKYHGCRTALHYASDYGHEDIVSLLLKCDADANIKDDSGETPLHYASANGHKAIVTMNG